MTVREWADACLKHWILLAGAVTATAAAAGTVTAYWDSFRPYATTKEVAQVAQRTYPPALSEVQGKMLFLQKRLDYLDKLGETGSLKSEQWIERPQIRGLIGDLKEQETQILKEQAKFRLYLEHQ